MKTVTIKIEFECDVEDDFNKDYFCDVIKFSILNSHCLQHGRNLKFFKSSITKTIQKTTPKNQFELKL